MTTSGKDLPAHSSAGMPNCKTFRIGVVCSQWNEHICSQLLEGAQKVFAEQKLDPQNIHTVRVPGAFELPYAASLLFRTENIDGVLCLGCVIKGETRHDEYINQAVAFGITQLSMSTGKPVVFGVLTTETQIQAEERSGGRHGNKGTEGAVTLLKMIDLRKRLLVHTSKNIGFQ